MEPPRGGRHPQDERAPSWAHVPIPCAQPQPDRLAPPPAWELADGLGSLPRWKRFVLLYVKPVCMAMVWQCGVVVGLLLVFILGLTLIRLLGL